MKKILKIGVLGLMFLLLTGCSNKVADDKILDEKNGVENMQPQIDEIEHKANEEDIDAEDDLASEGNNEEQENNEGQGDFAQDVIIALDAGHGGGFTGASYNGRNEKDLALSMAFYVKEYLEENYQGMKIYLVRDKDSALSGDVIEDLELRAQYAQDVNADALVSLHFNASDSHEQSGAMVLISNQENVTEASENLANNILAELEGLGLKNQGTVKRNSNDLFDDKGKPLDYYAINRHSALRDIPGIIVEHCFMDHAGDQQYIDSEEDLRILAKADAIGIAKYFGLSPR